MTAYLNSAFIRTLLVGAFLGISSFAFAEIGVPDSVPTLPPGSDFPPGVEADVFPPAFGGFKGYHVSEIKPGSDVFWITDGNYHSMAIVHDKGVVVVDAPQPLPFDVPGFPGLGSISANMPVLDAVEDIRVLTGRAELPITHLIYSHAHTDHIGGASAIKDANPKVKIIGHVKTRKILEEIDDPRRPVPKRVFKKKRKLKIGGQRIELHNFGNTHQAGNTLVWLPEHKILLAIDIIYPGWVPFRRLALSEDIRGWLAGHEAVDSFDFDVLVSGHVTRLGTKADVAIAMEYNADIKEKIEEIYTDVSRFFAAVAAVDSGVGAPGTFTAFTTSLKWALFSAFYDASAMHCAEFLDAKYNDNGLEPPEGEAKVLLAGGETFNFSNCEAYFVALRLGNVEAPEAP